MRRVAAFILSLALIFSLVSSSAGFDNNKENYDRVKREFIPYNNENINSGKIKGGHDTLTAEGMLLKEKVHKRTDPDGGTRFVEEFSTKALPSLRTGAHDEDTNKLLNWHLNDPPIGPNGWGNFFEHFYTSSESGLGSGLKYWWNPATERAKDYTAAIRGLSCKSQKRPLTGEERKRLHDYLGRVLHLIQDMGNPAHTQDDIHVFTKTFEDYVRDNWKEIVSRDWFKASVNPEQYREGDYGNFTIWNPERYIESLAEVSSRYPTDGLGKLSQEQVETNARALIPLIIKTTAGYIDNIYNQVSGLNATGVTPEECESPPDPPSPAGDHPDDRFDVSDEFYWEKEFGITDADLTNLFLRTAMKKGKIGVWYKKQFVETFSEGRARYEEATVEERTALERKLDALKQKMEERKNELESDWNGAPDVALFANGFYDSSISLMLKIGEPVSFQDINFNPEIVKDHPVLLIPTGGFYGLEKSDMVKAILEEYVRGGGTLVVFAQQHGYDWSLLPVPVNPETGERTPLDGFGYQQDQSCHFNSVYIDTNHPILSGFSTSTATIGVDGYFISYPEGSMILLRRTANDQPAMILYPFGNGYVLATTMYTDFAFTHHQANQSEITLIQNIISWAKKPDELVEIKPGEVVDLSLALSNLTDTDAMAIKLSILGPSRQVISEEIKPVSLLAVQSVTIPVSYSSSTASALGIFHIDYTLLDAEGNVVQPQAETDSGRFVVSDPPKTGYQRSDLTFSLQSDSEGYVVDSVATFILSIWNNSDVERTLTAKYDNQSTSITVAPKTLSNTIYRKVVTYGNGLWVSLFDESGKNIGNLFKFCRPVYPWVSMTASTDKTTYAKGETVTINTSLKNGIALGWQPDVRITVVNSVGRNVFEEAKTVSLPPNGSFVSTTSFKLSSDLMVGSFIVTAAVSYGGRVYGRAYTRFELPQSRCTVTPDLPVVFTQGTTIIPFTITNNGLINISSGRLEVSLRDPDRQTIHLSSHPFSLPIGESVSLDVPISISSLRFGNYTLTYSQSDETRTGNSTSLTITNAVAISSPFDKTQYRMRDTINLKVNVMNMGKFILDNVSVTVSIPDAGYMETKSISLGRDPTTTELNYSVLIPETIAAGWHYGNVTLMLPGGDSIVQGVGFAVSQSSLALRYEGTTSLSWGDVLDVIVENTGGVDTTYGYNIYLYDRLGNEVETTSGSGSVLAGGQDSFSYTLPEQLKEGWYSLTVEVNNQKTDKTVYRFIPLNVSGLNGRLSVKTDKDIYFSSEATTTLSTIINQDKPIQNGNLHLEIGCANPYGSPGIPESFHISPLENNNWVERGVLHFPYYFERRELIIPLTLSPSGFASVRFEQRGIESAFIEYIALKDEGGKLYSPSYVGVVEADDYTSESQTEDGWAADVTGRAFYAEWVNLPSDGDFTLVVIAKEGEGCGVIWEEDRVINQNAGATETIAIPAGVLGLKGKFYLRGILINKYGQTIDFSSHPFYIIDSDTVLTFSTDKEAYRPGDTVTITGQVENRAQITAESLNVRITSDGQEIYAATLNLPAGGVYPFTFNSTAGSEGTVTLLGTVHHHQVTLISIEDLYEVASPSLDIYVEAPEVIGKESFDLNVWMMNWEIVDARVTLKISDHKANVIDERQITIPAGEERLLQYNQQITENTIYTLEVTGDVTQTLNQAVTYGEAVQITIDTGGNLHPEGKIPIHVMISNTGQLDERIEVTYDFTSQKSEPLALTKSYYLLRGETTKETVYFELNEGDYQITARTQVPMASAQASFSVKKDNRVEMMLSLGTQSDGLLPLDVTLSNIGFNTLDGDLWLRLYTGEDEEIWNSQQSLSQLFTQDSRLLSFAIDPSAFAPGDYTLNVELLSNSGQSMVAQSLSLKILGPILQFTQIPGYQVFYPGEEGRFVFKVKNTGDQEGAVELSLKAYDLMDSVQREWLKPGEEKAISFTFTFPEDLEEKDYFASYELKDLRGQDTEGAKGQIKYRFAGINVGVHASLDKPYYHEGETAYLSLIVSTPGSPASGLNLFARVNYNGHESQQAFTLGQGQAQPLQFEIPLIRITGEKLFYGIYHESGRSIHLNSLYVYKAGDVITVTTDKQVYAPGELVSVSVSGNASGSMTLSAPGGYEETFPFSGQATKGFSLPSTMTAGTYFIDVELRTQTSELFTANHPIDVAGIQVKVLECKNDRGKYSPSDIITTNFTIFSNTATPAILKAWIVDPERKYTSTGEINVNLSSSENSLVTHNSLLKTGISGIHRLTYGIYSGDLLLVSGSEAFDVGEAVLLGLSTDKIDYPNPNEPVHAKVKLYGTAPATLDFLLDGEPAGSLQVSLSGFNNIELPLSAVPPGPHTLKAILTSGGLTSIKETTFVYGSNLPDLVVYIYTDQVVKESNLRLTVSVFNQGKTDAGMTSLYLYDGMIAPERFLTTFDVKPLGAKESQTFTYHLNSLGRTGTNILYAVIDPNNLVYEFNESNNENQITLGVPELTLSTSLEKELYPIGESVTIRSLITNLSKDTLSNITLTTRIKDASNAELFTDSRQILSIDRMATTQIDTSWQTDLNLSEGLYTIYQNIEGRDAKTQKTVTLTLERDFTITADSMNQKIETGEIAQYNLTLTSLRGFAGEISLSIEGCPEGFTASFDPNPLSLSGGATQALLKLTPTGQVKSGSFTLKVNATGGGISHAVSLLLDVTDFQMTVTPAIQTIKQLSEALYTISLTSMNHFEGKVNLEVIGVPKGMRTNLSANQVLLPKEVTFTLETSKWLVPGHYEVTIQAKGRVISHEVTVALTVQRNPGLTPGIVTAPGPLNKPTIHTFLFNGELVNEFQVFDSRSSASIAAGDLDGDGIDEMIAGTSWKLNRSPAILRIFRKDGAPVGIIETEYRSRFGLTVAVGDIDGDWVEDVAMGFYTYLSYQKEEEDDFDQCNEFPANCHYVSRGLGGVRIFTLVGERLVDAGAVVYPYESEHYRGAPNLALADVDGDGLPELITAPGPEPCAPAKIKVFKIDTKDGVGRWRIASLLTEFIVPFGKDAGFGANLAAGDVDGDGRPEIIVGAGPDPRNPPIVKVYRGDGTFTGTQFIAYPDFHLGRILNHEIVKTNRFGVYVAVGDMETDGISEIITGMGPGPLNEGWVRIFRGDGTPVGNGFLAYPKNMKFGVRVSSGNIGE